MQNKLVVIDGNSLFYRSFFALPLLSNDKGEFSNAVYGFAIQIVKIIQDIKPTHIAVAFDVTKHTFRHDIYKDYKATRKPMPEELRSQIEPLKKMLSLMNIKMCEMPNIEGDDIVGTLCKRFADTQTIIVTADRDTLQLIDDTTNVYFTKKGTSELYIVDRDVLKQDYGVTPAQIVDLKALMGDSSDNIPGVEGIGPKTAQSLLEKYDSLDGIYEHIDEIGGKVKDKLIANKDNAYLSYKLATIKTDVDIDCSLDDCKYDYPFDSKVYDFFAYYSFKTLLKKEEIFGEKTEPTKAMQYTQIIVNDAKMLKNMANLLSNSSNFAFFEENNILHFSIGQVEYIIDLALPFWQENVGLLKEALSSKFASKTDKILFDSKSVRHFLTDKKIELADPIFDISIAKNLIDGVGIKYIEDVMDESVAKNYPACGLYALRAECIEQLKDLGMWKLYSEVEIPLACVLFDMEQTGFKIDTEVLESLSQKYHNESTALEAEIYATAGQIFNINSPKQLGEVLFDYLKLPHKKNKSTSAENLENIKDSHPVVPLILRYRKIAKIIGTYIDGFRPHLDKNDMVHTSFKQTLTNTGRLSSTEPNLQNIPVRSDESREIRSMFVASSKDNVLVDADYSQIELRILAHMSGDEDFANAFKNNIDIHTQTACQTFGVMPDLVTRDMRRIAKVVNFGIIYGISEYGLSSDLKISAREAKNLIDKFYLGHPKVKEFMENSVKVARETGRVSTIMGRSRKMLDISSSNYMLRSRAERASQNMPLQGSAADIVKVAMIRTYEALKKRGLKAKLILQVHDELIIDCPKNELEEVKEIVRDSMENAYKLNVPLTVDVEASYRWSDGH